MEDGPASIPTPYEGLQVKTADIFPISCARCQRRFTNLSDYIARTTPMFHSSGLMERDDGAGDTFVLLLRNCLCGTSLALRCKDRRDRSQNGVARRKRFNTLVALLVESGTDVDKAQEEVRRVLQQQPPPDAAG